jgi:NAD(P)H dehydrogenase (quinone)
MAAKVSIIYYSATGTTYRLAQAVEQGASEAGADVRLRKVRELAPDEAIASNQGWAAHRLESQRAVEASLDDLTWADAIVFGTPTRCGLPTAQLKQFLDTTGPLWAQGTLVNKICSAFTSAASAHGGRETTIVNLNITFYHWGGIIVGPGYADPIQFKAGNPYGTSFTSNYGALKPDETALAAARFQGGRLRRTLIRFSILRAREFLPDLRLCSMHNPE